MPSMQKCADILREQAYKTLTPQIQALEDELQNVNKLLADKVRNIGYKLEALRHTEFPATEPVLNDYLQNDIRKRDLGGEMLALFTRELRTKETQEEILTFLLDCSVNCFPRVALFVVRGDMFAGWSSRGFSDLTARIINSDKFRQADCLQLQEALVNGDETESVDLSDTGSMCHMRGESSGAWRFYPLHVLGRPVAILIAGEAGSFDCRPKALSILMDCAALRLENVALKIIRNLRESTPANAVTTLPDVESPDAFRPNPVPIEITSSLEFAGESHYKTGIFRPNPLAGLKLFEQYNPVVQTPATTESEQEAIVETADDAPDPAHVKTQPGDLDSPLSPNPEEEKLHAAARRFAELLVSEIKPYNEDAVVEGRENRDLYKRLRRDMDRSREMYEKRVAPTVACEIDYLHNEFVRILGNGDAEAFGGDYPGPCIRE